MPDTYLTNLVNPEVMGDMIAEALPKAITVSPFAAVDSKLQGVPGDTVTVPVYAYIGDAEDVAEGGAIPTSTLTATTTKVTIKKAGKGVNITDEAMLSGYGNPLGNAQGQLTKAIASKIDSDCIDSLSGVTTNVYTGTTIINYDGVVDAVDLFDEETQTPKVMFVHPKQVTQIRHDQTFLDINKYPITNGVVMTGTIGQLAGCQVVPSRRVKVVDSKYVDPIIKIGSEVTDTDLPAFTIYLKREVLVESGRDMDHKITKINADKYYAVAVSNPSKVVLAKFLKVAA